MSHIGLDVGFTGTKAVIFSTKGDILARSYFDYGSRYKKDLLEKGEINPKFILNGIKKVLSACNSRSLKDKPKTIAVSVSGDDLFPMDKKGRPLYNALASYNQKPVKYRDLISDKLDGQENIFNETGQVLDTDIMGLPRILWLIDNIPNLLDKTWKFLCWESYINLYLTGIAATDFSNASRFVTFDINKNCWSDKILGVFGLSEDKMPEALLAGSTIGKIRDKVADELELPHGLHVVAGGFDQATAALGAGVIDEGKFSLGMGTVFASHWAADGFKKLHEDKKPYKDKEAYKNKNLKAIKRIDGAGFINGAPAKAYPYCSYLIKDKYMGLLCNFNGSNIVNWFFDNLASYEKARYKNKVYDYYNEKIDPSPSNLFFMPHFMGATYPVNDLNSRGTCIGLDLSTGKKDLIKSIYEGLAFELKINYSNLAKVSGFNIDSIIAIGGSSRSRVWLQILSNILNINISTVTIDEGGCLACAILGAVSSGEFADITEGVKSLVKIKDSFAPESKNHSLFEDKFEIYKTIYENTKKFSDHLSRHKKGV